MLSHVDFSSLYSTSVTIVQKFRMDVNVNVQLCLPKLHADAQLIACNDNIKENQIRLSSSIKCVNSQQDVMGQ